MSVSNKVSKVCDNGKSHFTDTAKSGKEWLKKLSNDAETGREGADVRESWVATVNNNVRWMISDDDDAE